MEAPAKRPRGRPRKQHDYSPRKARKNRVKMPNMRRVYTGPKEAKKVVRSLHEATELRRDMRRHGGNASDVLKVLEDAAVKLYTAFLTFPDLVSRLPDFFKFRYEEEEKNGLWSTEASRQSRSARRADRSPYSSHSQGHRH